MEGRDLEPGGAVSSDGSRDGVAPGARFEGIEGCFIEGRIDGLINVPDGSREGQRIGCLQRPRLPTSGRTCGKVVSPDQN